MAEERTVRRRALDLATGDKLSSGEIVVRIVKKAMRIPQGKVWIRLKKADGSERDVEWNSSTNLMVTSSSLPDGECR